MAVGRDYLGSLDLAGDALLVQLDAHTVKPRAGDALAPSSRRAYLLPLLDYQDLGTALRGPLGRHGACGPSAHYDHIVAGHLLLPREVDRPDRADLDAPLAHRTVVVELYQNLVQVDRIHRARTDARTAVHASGDVNFEIIQILGHGLQLTCTLPRAASATRRGARRTSSPPRSCRQGRSCRRRKGCSPR